MPEDIAISKTLRGFSGPLEERVLIRELVNTYADAAFQGDREAWLACWSAECLWVVMGKGLRGKAALSEQWAATWAHLQHMTFFTELGAVRVSTDQAQARCYTREILLFKNGSTRNLVGIYEDHLVKEAGVWLFSRRDYRLLIDDTPR